MEMDGHKCGRHGGRGAGFTLAEVLMASVVLGLSVLAISQAIVSGQMHAYAGIETERGMMLCESMVERLMPMPYFDSTATLTMGAEGGESAAVDFDSLDDYHGYGETAGDLRDAKGVLLPDEFQGFTRSVSMTAGQMSVASLGQSVDGITVVVTVTSRGGREFTVERFIAEPQ